MTRPLLFPTLLLTLSAISAQVRATDLKPLDDSALSDVRGRDGVSFAVNLNANIGSVDLGATDSSSNPATIALNNVLVTGTVAATLDITGGTATTPAYINWAYPSIAGLNNLQFGFDLAINADGTTLGTGVQFQNVAFGGTNLQMTPYLGTGIAFGLGLNLQIGNVLLQPNGRGITTGQMDISGVSIGAAGSTGAPWVIADINNQPGILNIVTDSTGTPNLQWGIGWATIPGSAPSGSIQINNVTFTTPDGNVNLGSSSIGSLQIQYLNIRFKS